MTVPYTFATLSGNIPLAELDANFASVANNVSTANSALTAGTVTTNAQPTITSVGTLTGLSVTGNVTAGLFVGNITGSIANASYATTAGFATTAGTANLAAAATTAGTVTTAAQPNITSVGTLNSLLVTGNVATSGNITANLFVGNITGSIANALYANTAGTANTATTAGFANTAGTANTATTASYANVAGAANTATTAGTVTTNAQSNITSVGTLTSLLVSGNINAGNVIATNLSGPILLSYQTTPQSLATGTANLIYNTATVNSSNYYDSARGIFQPLVPGYYQVNATIFPALISGTANASFFLTLYKNGSTVLSAGPAVTITPTWGTISLSFVSLLVPFNGTTDYINCKITSTITSGTWTTQAGVPSYFQACWTRGI